MNVPCRPSASSIWTKCVGYPRLISTLPKGWETRSADPAREGTCAAWVAECTLNHVTQDMRTCHDMIGRVHENGWVVDADMASFVQGYVNLLHNRYGDTVQAEQHVRLSDHIAGTPDAWAFRDGTLYVDDLKYGHGIVEPWENTQVMIYAGAIAQLITERIDRVVLGIYQPRAYHPLGHHRTWEPSVEELSQRLAVIIDQSNAAQSPEAVCTPGEHCRHCEAAHHCSAVAFEAYRSVSFMRNDMGREMSEGELSAELKFLELAEAVLSGRKTAVRADAKARIESGKLVPDYHLQRGKGQRRWKYDAATVHAMTGVDPRSDKMVTPAALERRKADKKMVATLTETPSTAPKLERVSQHVIAKQFGG